MMGFLQIIIIENNSSSEVRSTKKILKNLRFIYVLHLSDKVSLTIYL